MTRYARLVMDTSACGILPSCNAFADQKGAWQLEKAISGITLGGKPAIAKAKSRGFLIYATAGPYPRQKEEAEAQQTEELR